MSPLEFLQRLAALVPRPRLHLIRFHGVLAPHAKLRAQIVPSAPAHAHEACDHHAQTPPEAPGRMSSRVLAQTGIRYRHRTLPALWRALEDHRRYRRSPGDRQDPHAPGLARARSAARTGAAHPIVPSSLTPEAPRPASIPQPASPLVLSWRTCPSVSRDRRAWRMSGPSKPRKREVCSANSPG